MHISKTQRAKPNLGSKLLPVFEVIALTALGLFSYLAVVVLKHVRAEIISDAPLAPISRLVLHFWHLIHLPFILLIMVTIARLAGVLKNQQLWAICLLLCFAAFALLAGIWLLGATVPFWTMRGSIGGN